MKYTTKYICQTIAVVVVNAGHEVAFTKKIDIAKEIDKRK